MTGLTIIYIWLLGPLILPILLVFLLIYLGFIK
jgi:hypothetical protein